jgi:hypothetical protein
MGRELSRLIRISEPSATTTSWSHSAGVAFQILYVPLPTLAV